MLGLGLVQNLVTGGLLQAPLCVTRSGLLWIQLGMSFLQTTTTVMSGRSHFHPPLPLHCLLHPRALCLPRPALLLSPPRALLLLCPVLLLPLLPLLPLVPLLPLLPPELSPLTLVRHAVMEGTGAWQQPPCSKASRILLLTVKTIFSLATFRTIGSGGLTGRQVSSPP